MNLKHLRYFMGDRARRRDIVISSVEVELHLRKKRRRFAQNLILHLLWPLTLGR